MYFLILKLRQMMKNPILRANVTYTPKRPTANSNFPSRPPSQILLTPKRRTDLLLAKAQSRIGINPNTIHSVEDAMIT